LSNQKSRRKSKDNQENIVNGRNSSVAIKRKHTCQLEYYCKNPHPPIGLNISLDWLDSVENVTKNSNDKKLDSDNPEDFSEEKELIIQRRNIIAEGHFFSVILMIILRHVYWDLNMRIRRRLWI